MPLYMKQWSAIVAVCSLLALASLIVFNYGSTESINNLTHYMMTSSGGGLAESKGKLKQNNFTFVPTYVSARPHPPVTLITYLTQGQLPSWNVTPGEKIVYTPVPHRDSHVTHFMKKDINYLNHLLHDMDSNIPVKLRFVKIAALKKVQQTLKPDISKKLEMWYNVTQGSSEIRNNLSGPNGLKYQLNTLLKKKDPESPWTLKCNGCFKNDFKTILEPRQQLCAGDNDIDIVVIVTSVPRSVHTRKTVRETWGSWTKNNTSNFRLIFLFGDGWPEADNKLLAKESTEYGDILQEDYQDSYYNLTQKVISGFKWVLRSCSRAQFVLRAAEDGFVFLPEVLGLLQTYGSDPRFQNYQIGECYINFRPHRWPDFKGYLSTDDYGDHIFPPYALGTSFITSRNLTRRIVARSQNITYIPIEDSYFGLVLRDIGSGCLNVHPFPPSGNAVSDAKKYQIFRYILQRI